MRVAPRPSLAVVRGPALAGLALFLALAACGGDDPAGPDAGAIDARPLDTGAPDAESPDGAEAPDAEPDAGLPDSGPPDIGSLDAGGAFHAASCVDGCPDCGDGLCVSSGGEQFCVDRCDSDPDGCVSGFTCLDIGAAGTPTLVCVPPASCEQPGVGWGTGCSEGTESCLVDRQRCQGDRAAIGICTDSCETDATCPPGWACTPGDEGDAVCVPRYATGAQRCAQESMESEPPCTWDGDCAAGWACVGYATGRSGVCAAPARPDETCEAGFVLRRDPAGALRCLPQRCGCRGVPALAPGVRDLLGEALASVGLDRCSAIHRVEELVANTPDVLGDPYRFAALAPLLGEPWRIPGWAHTELGRIEAPLDVLAHGPSARAAEVMEALAALGETPTSPAPLEPVDPLSPLVDAVARFVTEAGGQPDRAALEADAADVAPAVQLAVATVVEGARQALIARRAAFAATGAANIAQLYDYGPAFVIRRRDGLGLAPANPRTQTLLTEGVDYGAFATGAAAVLRAVDTADLSALALTPPAGTATVATSTAVLLFSQQTPAGRIAIGGGDSGLYDPRLPGFDGAWAVLVDLGGHDTYRIAAGGNASVANPVSVLIDLGGRDRYGYVEVPSPLDGARLVSDAGGRYRPTGATDGGPVSLSESPRQGGARAGIAAVIDLGTDDDVYTALRLAQGAAVFGAGVLLDEGGDDIYRGEVMVQGAAAFGYALFLDLAGNDAHDAYQFAQGFSFARAAAAAIDGGGDDRWLMDLGDPAQGGDPLYPSAQRPTNSNASLGQGFSFGRRADFSDGAHMSGGVAILLDRAGDDTYRGSVFAQGGGFWFGAGILADRGGRDTYDGLWYQGGTAAHYAIGLLLDGGGDDRYGRSITPVNVTLGGGHDWSAAFLIDEAGDDDYLGSRITLGSGNANGFGFLVDNAGDDAYETLAPTYGTGAAGLRDEALRAPGSPRRKVDTVGVFIDARGTDTYRAAMAVSMDAADDRTWRHSESPEPEIRAMERGAGLDGVGESSLHAR